MKNALLGTAAFIAGSAVPGLLLSAATLLGRPAPRDGTLDDFLFAAYLIAVSSGIAAVGFLACVAIAPSWRRLSAVRASAIAAGLGLMAPIAHFVGAALAAGVVLPLFRTAPWLAMAVYFGLPGVVLGVSALLLGRLWPGAARVSPG